MKNLLFFLLFTSWFAANSQLVKKLPIESDQVYAKCVSATHEYLIKTIDKKILAKYFEFEREYSHAIISHDLTIFDGRQPKKGEILGYVMNFRIKPEYTDTYKGGIDFTLFVNPQMKVWFDKGWNSDSDLPSSENIAPRLNLQPEDRSLVYLNSMKEYITAFDEGRLLTKPQILAAADKYLPGMKWRKPIISRESFPPYNAYWEVTQDECQRDCPVLHIKIDEPIVIKTSKVSFRRL